MKVPSFPVNIISTAALPLLPNEEFSIYHHVKELKNGLRRNNVFSNFPNYDRLIFNYFRNFPLSATCRNITDNLATLFYRL